MRKLQANFFFIGKNFLTGFIIMLGGLVALLGVQAFQSLSTNPTTAGNQSLESPLLTRLGHGGSIGIKRMFITTEKFNGNLGGVAGADAKCQTAANSASLGGNWMAILTNATTSFTVRNPNSEKYYYVNLLGQPIFTNGLPGFLNKITQRKSASDFVSFNNFTYENNVLVPNNTAYWSNIYDNGGSLGSSSDCNGWINGTSSYYGYYGNNMQGIDSIGNPAYGSTFYYYTTASCAITYSLRCIEL